MSKFRLMLETEENDYDRFFEANNWYEAYQKASDITHFDSNELGGFVFKIDNCEYCNGISDKGNNEDGICESCESEIGFKTHMLEKSTKYRFDFDELELAYFIDEYYE